MAFSDCSLPEGARNSVGVALKCNNQLNASQKRVLAPAAAFAGRLRRLGACGAGSGGGEADEEGVGVGDDVGVGDGERGFERGFR